MPHEERVSYDTIKSWVLDAYYDFCRDRGLIKRCSHREILGGIDYEFENTFGRPIENLMLCVVQLVLTGGWYIEAEEKMRRYIVDQITTHGLDNLLSNIPPDEATTFRRDLNLLKLNSE